MAWMRVEAEQRRLRCERRESGGRKMNSFSEKPCFKEEAKERVVAEVKKISDIFFLLKMVGT